MQSFLRMLWIFWQRFWFRRVPARPLGVFRIALGSLCLLFLLLSIPHWELWYSIDGMIGAKELTNPPMLSSLGFYPLSLLYLQKYALLKNLSWIILGLGILSSITFALGYRTRISGIILLACWASMANYLYPIRDAQDSLITAFLFLLLFTESGRSLSLDAQRAQRPHYQQTITVWPIYLIMSTLIFMYFFIGFDKLISPQWQNGQAIYYTLALSAWSDFPEWTIFRNEIICAALTYGTIAFEIIVAFTLLHSRLRSWTLLLLIPFHLGLCLLLGRTVLAFNLAVFVGLILFVLCDQGKQKQHT